jgi:predicted  nucleic acid-binding Zn-ribbon protein
MDSETREKFKKRLEEMIQEATVKEEAASNLQTMVATKRQDFEKLSTSGSTSRSRRNKATAISLEEQVESLEDELTKVREQIRGLWTKIGIMQAQEKDF